MAKVLITLEPHNYEPVAARFSVQFFDVGQLQGSATVVPKWPFPHGARAPVIRRPGFMSTVRIWVPWLTFVSQDPDNKTPHWISLWEQHRIEGVDVTDQPQYRFMIVVDTEAEGVIEYVKAAFFEPLGLTMRYTDYDPEDGIVTELTLEHIKSMEVYMETISDGKYRAGQWRTNARGQDTSDLVLRASGPTSAA